MMRIKLLVLVLSVLISGCAAEVNRTPNAEDISTGTDNQPKSNGMVYDLPPVHPGDAQTQPSESAGNDESSHDGSKIDEDSKYIDNPVIDEESSDDDGDDTDASSEESIDAETQKQKIDDEQHSGEDQQAEDKKIISPERPPKPEIPDNEVTEDILPDSVVAESLNAAGLDNLYRVSNDIYRSAQPTPEGLISAGQLGIKTVLSLQVINLDPALEGASESGLNFEHVSMVPWNISESNLVDALLVIRDAPKPILVHCLHGSDRTGLVIALYRILFQGWTPEAAKNEMINGGFGYHSEFANIPEMLDSVDMEKLSAALFGKEN
ncbi:MAG: tyrosine-protein phosphatase [Proteobacteria bacterium]|nr:tyrosine-protein phosphatase [Pseudomonadota bacterium]